MKYQGQECCLSSDAPAHALAVDAILHQKDIWHLASKNPPVRSCREAASQRRRLGSVGIPLADELKSVVYAVSSRHAPQRYVVLHARGHQRFDLEKATAVLQCGLRSVSSQELRQVFGLEYGTVNPLGLSSNREIIQLFDDTLVERYYPPYTVMTNCGDLRHAVELRASDLIRCVPNSFVGDVVLDTHKSLPQVRSFGILTGNCPESGMLLWERLNNRLRSDSRLRIRGDCGLPKVIIQSVPEMGASMELAQRSDDVRRTVLRATADLCEAGADVIAIACNTTQYLADSVAALCASRGKRFVNLASATGAYLGKEGITQFDFLGIRPVADLTDWSAFGHPLAGLDVRLPTSRQIEMIEEIAYEVKAAGASSRAYNLLRDLLNSIEAGCTTVIAVTEISVLLGRQRGDRRQVRRYIDTLDVLAERLVDLYVADRIAVGAS